MRLPVDTSAVSFISAGPPEPTIDFETKAQKTDDAGLFINQVHLFTGGAAGRDVITVKPLHSSGQPLSKATAC